MSAVLETPQLPAIQRAAIALRVEEVTKEFTALAASSKSITGITNEASYQECHAARMRLVKARTTTTKRGKEVREDAQTFSKSVIEQEKTLLAIIEPEEKRLQKIQDDFDAIEADKKRVAAEAEAKRIADIQAKIEAIKAQSTSMVGRDSVAIKEVLGQMQRMPAPTWADEFRPQVDDAVTKCILTLDLMLTGTLAQEAAVKVEADRVAAERAELAKLRAEQEERDRTERVRLAEEAKVRELENQATRAKIEQEQQESQRRIDEAERLAKEKRDQEDAARAQERAKADAEARMAAEAQAKEEARLKAERDVLEAEQREIQRQREELLDGNALLKRFLEKYGKRPEFRKVVTAIHAHLTAEAL